MEQRLSLVTLGVADLARSKAFYEGLGWSSGAAPNDDVVFFAGGMIVALWGREQLAEDSVVEDTGGWGGSRSPTTPARRRRSTPSSPRPSAPVRRSDARARRPSGAATRRLHRPRRPPLGGRAQPGLDAPRGRLGPPEARAPRKRGSRFSRNAASLARVGGLEELLAESGLAVEGALERLALGGVEQPLRAGDGERSQRGDSLHEPSRLGLDVLDDDVDRPSCWASSAPTSSP